MVAFRYPSTKLCALKGLSRTALLVLSMFSYTYVEHASGADAAIVLEGPLMNTESRRRLDEISNRLTQLRDSL